MTKAGCGRCDGTGWVCENHPFRPWGPDSKRLDACDCGAGAPCPICNTLNPCLGDLVQAANLAALVVASPAVISRAAERRVWRVRSIQSRGRFGRDHLTGFAL